MRITSIIITIILYFVYLYLRNLNNCACVNQEYELRLKNIMSIFLTISVLSLIINLLSPSLAISIMSFNDNTKRHLALFAILPALIIVVGYIYIYGYFVYDTYMFSSTMSIPCTCANGWQKYYIYFQAIVMVLIILGSVSAGIKMALNPGMLFSSTTPAKGYQGKNYNKNYKRNKNKRSRK